MNYIALHRDSLAEESDETVGDGVKAAESFDQYRPWARPLTKPMPRQIGKIREETRAIHGLADLLQRIEETGLGAEQEIVDYR